MQWATSPHLTSHQITSHYSTPLFIEWHHITSPYFISDHSNNFVSLHVTSHNVTSSHFLSCFVFSIQITSFITFQFKSLRLSLSDSVWYKMIRCDLTWFDVKGSIMEQFDIIWDKFFLWSCWESDHSDHFASVCFTLRHVTSLLIVSSFHFKSLLLSLSDSVWDEMIQYDVKWFDMKGSRRKQFDMIWYEVFHAKWGEIICCVK